jgi:hypothetical protein
MTAQEPVLETGGPVVERGETGIRILYTLVLFLALRVAGIVLALLALFELGYTLVTREVAPPWVRAFANRTSTYLYEIARFISYNGTVAPFPFSGFPAARDRMPSEDELYPGEEPEGDAPDADGEA